MPTHTSPILTEKELSQAAFDLLTSSSIKRYSHFAQQHGDDLAARIHDAESIAKEVESIQDVILRAQALQREVATAQERDVQEVELAVLLATLVRVYPNGLPVEDLLHSCTDMKAEGARWVAALASRLFVVIGSNRETSTHTPATAIDVFGLTPEVQAGLAAHVRHDTSGLREPIRAGLHGPDRSNDRGSVMNASDTPVMSRSCEVSDMDNPNIAARNMAVRAHGNQRYGGGPYVHHLNEVVDILWQYGYTARETQQAGYLHDTLEDTSLTERDIMDAFGQVVADIVLFCTDEKGPNRKTRKALTYTRMRAVLESGDPPKWLAQAIRVKLADRLANLRNSSLAPPRGNPGLLAMYRGEAVAFRSALYLEGVADGMWDEYDRLCPATEAQEARVIDILHRMRYILPGTVLPVVGLDGEPDPRYPPKPWVNTALITETEDLNMRVVLITFRYLEGPEKDAQNEWCHQTSGKLVYALPFVELTGRIG